MSKRTGIPFRQLEEFADNIVPDPDQLYEIMVDGGAFDALLRLARAAEHYVEATLAANDADPDEERETLQDYADGQAWDRMTEALLAFDFEDESGLRIEHVEPADLPSTPEHLARMARGLAPTVEVDEADLQRIYSPTSAAPIKFDPENFGTITVPSYQGHTHAGGDPTRCEQCGHTEGHPIHVEGA